MLDLLGTAFQPASDAQDKITYLTSVKYLLSVQTETPESVAEKIKDLLSETSSSLDGMRFLEIALQQKPDIYPKGRWSVILLDVLKDSLPVLFKEQACNVYRTIFDILSKDPIGNSDEIRNLFTSVFPYLITATKDDIEWMEPAILCLTAGVKSFPTAFEVHKEALRQLILRQTYIASSKHFEPLADCFTVLPNCSRNVDPKIYQEFWLTQYLRTLNTMHSLLNHLLSFLPDEYKTLPLVEFGTYDLEDTEKETENSGSTFQHVRQFINLCRCLAKMLSSKSKFAVQMPVKLTLEFIARLFAVEELAKLNASSPENQLIMTTLCQLQIAVLVLLEPLIMNFNLLPFSYYVSHILHSALQASSLPNISTTTVSQIRHTVWKVLNVWLGTNGAKVTVLVVRQPLIIKQLLKDISVEEKSPQPPGSLSPRKAKKSASLNAPKKNAYINRNLYYVCKEALTALEQILYTGAAYLSKGMFEEIFSAVVHVARLLHPSQDPPFPYDNVKCRVNLYSVLLAITLVCKPEQRSPILSAIGIFNNALRDPNAKVKSFSRKAAATCRAFLHPKRPPPLIRESDIKQKKRSDNPSAMVKYAEWSMEDTYQNIPPVENVSNVSEDLPPHAQNFHNPNDSEMHSNDYVQVEPCYSEQVEENQLNGDDILEIQNSSQCQDEESDEDEEEEEEEEEDDRSYIEEDMEIPPEHIYIPSTSELQVINPVHIDPEIVQDEEQEYEELRPASKGPASVPDDSNSKNMHLNGVHSILPDEVPSASTQNIANENGINGSEDEEMEEEEGDEDEEEEEHTYPAEKKVPEFFEAPAKKPKLDTEVEEMVEDADLMDQRSRSPTLIEMKADFCFSEVENVTS